MSTFVNGEVALIEVSDDVLLVVNNGGVQNNLFYLFLENKNTIITSVWILGRVWGSSLVGRWRSPALLCARIGRPGTGRRLRAAGGLRNGLGC
jgi:hypothetical protein